MLQDHNAWHVAETGTLRFICGSYIGKLTLGNERTRLSLTRRSPASCLSTVFVWYQVTIMVRCIPCLRPILSDLKLVHE